MRLTYVIISGFRGYRNEVRIDFASDFTIIDGRNGSGKSTVFDAIEYALTGHISKYNDAKAAGETVEDYLWWTGEGPAPEDRFVEVGLEAGEKTFVVRRTPFEAVAESLLADIEAFMAFTAQAPANPLRQLCASSIIRDEHIASLSLDLKETERYALLRQALGANDADDWIERASRILRGAKQRHEAARDAVEKANSQVAMASRRIDEVRAGLVADTAMQDARLSLQNFLDDAAVDVESSVAKTREKVVEIELEVEALEAFSSRLDELAQLDDTIARLEAEYSLAESRVEEAKANLDDKASPTEGLDATDLSERARLIVEIIELSSSLGLVNGHCPACATEHTKESFEKGLERAAGLARSIDAAAASAAEAEAARKAANDALQEAQLSLNSIFVKLGFARRTKAELSQTRERFGFPSDVDVVTVQTAIDKRVSQVDLARRSVRILGAFGQDKQLQAARSTESQMRAHLEHAQEKAGLARRAEAAANALHDAARRAAAETLDERLDRVLPLMSELYKRLRPHQTWQDIEYAIRGDVKRFLSLQVGDGLNPQFLFSSGQRRATGIAFLLSVNLSLSWSRWKSILLDDPVQHVDDFRTIHLAEVLAQLVASGRQIICAVEDPALADLLCRRLPVNGDSMARKVSLGPLEDGSAGVLQNSILPALPNKALSASLYTQTG